MKKSLSIILLALSIAGRAQDSTTKLTTVTRASFLAPGFSYELPVGPKQTVYAQAFLATSAYYSYSSSLGSDGDVLFYPALLGQYRYYYNIAKRQSAGKRTEMNSANYIAPMVGMVFANPFSFAPSYENDFAVYLGAVWGMQRNYAKRFSLNLNVGPGFEFTKDYYVDSRYNRYSKRVVNFTILSQINLGFWLNKRK